MLADKALGIHYMPNNAFVMVATQKAALNISTVPGVVWVGRRSHNHKIEAEDANVLEMAKSDSQRRRTSWFGGEEEVITETDRTRLHLLRRQTLIVTLVDPSLRANCQSKPRIQCTSRIEGTPAATNDIVKVWENEMMTNGIRAQAEYVTEEKALVRILTPAHVVAVT
eukprot:1838786-Rhodomonas_salina.1